ncbi:hypothetical protein I9W82_002824 [Candida metapsilosis]|uniref:Transcription initiation factor TFIID subunit 8 n=1 Tax=Candida metapsilosis TaxID=273372 RepID=A0A8H7ZI37_9ASCO|nr:hypothetical protein I9W82_002824 [Candida metapsilosis]
MTSEIRPWEQSPADTQLTKIIAVLLNDQGYHFTEEFLGQVYDLATEYMNHLLANLLEYTVLQRRRKPSLSDLKLALEENDLSPDILAEQIQISKIFLKSHAQQIQAVMADHNEEPADNENYVNEHYAIMEVVPNMTTRPSYIPSYMPDLPPDYTYQSTPSYSQPQTDLKQLRTKLVEESRLTEKSLYKLIESDASELKLKAEFEKELTKLAETENGVASVEEVVKVEEVKAPENPVEKSVEQSVEQSVEPTADQIVESTVDQTEEPKAEQTVEPIAEQTAENTVEPIAVEQPEETTEPTIIETVNKFDFIEYAQKRKNARLRKQAKLEEQQQKRDSDIFMKAELYYSPYATKNPTPETNKYFKDILDNEFKKVIVSVRLEEERRRKELAAQKELKERQEREFRAQHEIQFNFEQRNVSDSSDLDSDAMEDF